MKNIIKSKVSDLDDVKFELNQNNKEKDNNIKTIDPNHPNHYVNNKELLEEFIVYNELKKKAISEGKDIPPLTEKIGKAIIQIATRRMNSWRFNGYSNSWKEEMTSNAITIAAIRGHNFDPEKSNNPFAYLTQICNNAIIEQLNRERRELYVRYKSMEDPIYQDQYDINTDSTRAGQYEDNSARDRLKYIEDYEKGSVYNRRQRQKTNTDNTNSLKFE